ncbi:MAG: 6-carboxytetrahydropterin synthase QueD [Spirochaetales bacterium]|jgi:6-pyruvoyltetrahydropterin/6-carboxytetrahydropterin synthase|nr:6-carboxytetrahydropterin synthase QueD [Spirochaetales bacterium]
MPGWTVRVEDSFAAAHFIKDYHGKCERLHGHNYRVRAYAAGETLGRGGMLFDFGPLKAALHEVLEELDHSLLNENPRYRETEPSAELIAFHIFHRLKSLLPGCPLRRIEVFETEKNMAAFEA